jgi:chromosome segregation ATPase
MSAYNKPTQIISLPNGLKGPGETIAIPPEHGSQPHTQIQQPQQQQQLLQQPPSGDGTGASYYSQNQSPVGPPRIFYELESIFVATRQMENALRKEQGRAAGIQRDLQAERTRYQQAVAEANHRIRLLSADLEKHRTDLATHQTNEEKLSGQVKTLSTALITVRNELETTRRALVAHKRKIAEDQEAHQHQLLQEQRRHATLTEQMQTLRQETENALKEQKSRYQQLSEHENKLKTELDTQIARREKLQENLDQTLSELNAEKIQSSKTGFQAQKAQNELTELRTRLEQTEEELGRLRKAWPEMVLRERKLREEASEKISRANAATRDSEDRSRRMVDEMTEFKMRNGLLDQEITRLTQALETSRTVVEQTRKELDQSRRETAQSRTDVLDVRNELQGRLQEAENQGRELGNKLVELQLHVQELRDGSVEVESEFKGAVDRMEAAETENVGLRDQISGFEHALNAMQAELSKSVLERDRDRARHEAELEALRSENERLRNIYPLRDLLATKEREINRVEQEMQGIPEDHPDRASVNEVLDVMFEQREQIRQILSDAERKAEV